MLVTVLLLIASAVAIYLACEWFVNAVEWLGARMNVGTVAVGTVLAAIGTALPESVVTFVAVVFGDSPERKQIGVGAAMGGPLVFSTLAYATIGVVLAVHHPVVGHQAARPGELISDQRVPGRLRRQAGPGPDRVQLEAVARVRFPRRLRRVRLARAAGRQGRRRPRRPTTWTR